MGHCVTVAASMDARVYSRLQNRDRQGAVNGRLNGVSRQRFSVKKRNVSWSPETIGDTLPSGKTCRRKGG